MALDIAYTSGVIAVREKYLLKERIYRLCELSAEEAFRMLLESGFGGGAETATSVYDYEKLIAVEEEKTDAFIREFAPKKGIAEYLLAPRDFHNAKALVKASYTGESAERMLAPEGLIPIATLKDCIQNADYTKLQALCPRLALACKDATTLLEEEPSGEKLGAIFQTALFEYLKACTKGTRVLSKLLSAKADMTNILTAFRVQDSEQLQGAFLPCGTLNEKDLEVLLGTDKEKILAYFAKTPYAEFVKVCLSAREKGLPMTQAEKLCDEYAYSYFEKKKYELEKSEPFLYYIYRRKTESANVRIIFVCLLAGLSEQEIKARIRGKESV